VSSLIYIIIIFHHPEERNIRELERKILFNDKTRFHKVSGLINFISRNFSIGKYIIFYTFLSSQLKGFFNDG